MRLYSLLAVLAVAMIGQRCCEASIVGVKFGVDGDVTAPANWNVVTSAVSPIPNLVDEAGHATAIDLAFSGSSGLSFFSGAPEAQSIPSHTNPLGTFRGNTYQRAAGSPVTFSATFSDLAPNMSYDVWVFGIRFGAILPLSQEVTITGAHAPVIFTQTSVGDTLWVNGAPGNSANSLQSSAVSMTSTALGKLSIGITGDDFFYVSGLAISAADTAIVPEPTSLAVWGGVTLLGAVAAWRRRIKGVRTAQ